MRSLRFIYYIPLLIGLGLAILLGIKLLSAPSATEANLMVGKAFPHFSLPSLINEKMLIDNSQLQHKKMLVNIFASWCAPCRVEHPLLMKLSQTHQIPIFGISWDNNKEAARMLLTKEGNPFEEVVLDNAGKLAINLGAIGIPETYIVDEKGIIVWHKRGPISEEIIERDILPQFKPAT